MVGIKYVIMMHKICFRKECGMLTTFKINLAKEELVNNISTKCECVHHIDTKKKLVQTILDCYNEENEYFDGTKMQEALFPQISQTSIFLSHSYSDVGMALAIKNRIESKCKNTKVFIDSLYWGSVYKAQEYIERKFDCDTGSILKYLHIMITTAIAQMIQSSKYFLFLESENSISDMQSFNPNAKTNAIYASLLKNPHNKRKNTQSPWIYYELQIAKMFEVQNLVEASFEKYRYIKIESSKKPMNCFF